MARGNSIAETAVDLIATMLAELIEFTVRLAKQSLVIIVSAVGVWAIWDAIFPDLIGARPLTFLPAVGLVIAARLIIPSSVVESIPPLSAEELAALRDGVAEPQLRLVRPDDETE